MLVASNGGGSQAASNQHRAHKRGSSRATAAKPKNDVLEDVFLFKMGEFQGSDASSRSFSGV